MKRRNGHGKPTPAGARQDADPAGTDEPVEPAAAPELPLRQLAAELSGESSDTLRPVRRDICFKVRSFSLRRLRMVSPITRWSCSSGVRARPFFRITRVMTSRNSSTLKGFLM